MIVAEEVFPYKCRYSVYMYANLDAKLTESTTKILITGEILIFSWQWKADEYVKHGFNLEIAVHSVLAYLDIRPGSNPQNRH